MSAETKQIQCTRCRHKHHESDRGRTEPDGYGMRTSICPRCRGHSYFRLGQDGKPARMSPPNDGGNLRMKQHEEAPQYKAPSSPTLLACPFCGGEAKPTAHLSYSWFAPVCKSCGARGPSVRIESGSDPQKLRELMNKADALWNARAF